MPSCERAREDFENEESAVIHRNVELALQVALLGGAQGLVEDDFARPVEGGQFLDFFGLAATDEQGRVGGLALARETGDGREAGSLRKQAEFLEFAVEMGQPEIDADENGGAFLAGDLFRQAGSELGKSAPTEAAALRAIRLRRRRSRQPRN